MSMVNPVLAEVTRGTIVESRHRGAVAVALASGELVLEVGEVASPVYPRSAVKPLQALAAVAAGVVDRFGLSEAEIAVMCASHGGEERHVAAILSILTKIGRGESALECGAHWPLDAEAARELARHAPSPRAVHNNCSGKHAGMLALAKLIGVEARGYIAPDHPVQLRIRAVLEAYCGASLGAAPCAIDGCSAPTIAVPLSALARGFARFATGDGVLPEFAAAARAIARAAAAEPFMISGTGRFCTQAMQHTGARALVKTGAEGMMCASLPGRGLGIAVKCEDGAARGAEVVMAHLLAAFGAADGNDPDFAGLMTRPVRNVNAIRTGEIRAAPALTQAIGQGRHAMTA